MTPRRPHVPASHHVLPFVLRTIIARAGVPAAVLAAAVLLPAGPAGAQALPATVSGAVTDQTGAALPGVLVDIGVGAAEQSTTTDLAGRYTLTGVPAGDAEITFRLLNFTTIRRGLALAPGATAVENAMLPLALSADVVVTAAATFRNIADVPNPAENLVGIASAASQGAITAAQLEARPVMRAGEVLETVPGMVISQHSGEGKANQYYLRGFNLDHGTDFSMTVAGVPVNMPTGAHAHGYADANFLIPELVSGVQFKKGPYFADEGDFSAAGAATVSYVNVLTSPLLVLSGGSQGWGRLLAAASPQVRGGSLLGAVELNFNDGPWERPDGLQKVNTVLRYSRGDARNGLSLSGMGYWADWRSTDQVPRRAIDDGRISRFGLIDRSDQGQANRQSLALEVQRSSGPASLRATGFVLRNSLNLFSNFTYFLDDPVRGDQFEQAERRVAAGGRVTYRRLGHLGSRHTESAAGVQLRQDWLDPVGLYRTTQAVRFATTREDEVSQGMLGAYAQTEVEWHRSLRTTIGLRADVYRYDVSSHTSANSGSGSTAMVNPKFTAVLGPWSGTEFYVNAGGGFHSNDARGAVIAVDPSTGETAEPVTPLVRATGAEVGLRTVAIPGVQSTVSVWYLGIASELLFVGDAGTTEAGRPSRRIGLEWSSYARLRPWLVVDGDVAFTQARFADDDPAGTFIPGALDRVVSAGVTVEPARRLFGSLRVRHFGPRSLIEDNSQTSRSTTIWNAEAGFALSPRARLVLEGYNLFDAAASDIDYFYASRLPGEPEEGIEDIHTHPAIPRALRVGVRFSF